MIVALLAWGLVAGTPIAVLFSVPLIPVAVTVAIVRYRLLDIRLVVSRALAWVLLSLGVIVAYVVLVAVLDRLISSSLGRSAVATVLLVLLAAPALPRLQRLVDRAMYGDRANPARVVSQLGAPPGRRPTPGLAGVRRLDPTRRCDCRTSLWRRDEHRARRGRPAVRSQPIRKPLTLRRRGGRPAHGRPAGR